MYNIKFLETLVKEAFDAFGRGDKEGLTDRYTTKPRQQDHARKLVGESLIVDCPKHVWGGMLKNMSLIDEDRSSLCQIPFKT